MRFYQTFQGPVIRRLFRLYLVLGLAPLVGFIVIPVMLHMRFDSEGLAGAVLLQFLIQGIGFLGVVLVGGLVTLQKLALPIQALAKGAEAITRGELSYRVPVRRGDDDLIVLINTFNTMAQAVQSMRDDIENQRLTLENALKEREEEFDAINAVAQLANRSSDLQSTLTRALTIGRREVNADVMSLSILDDSGELSCLTFSCDDSRRLLVQKHCMACMDREVMQCAITTRQPVKWENIVWKELSPALRNSYATINIDKIAALPVIGRGKVWGVIMIMRGPDNKIPHQKRPFIEALANHLTILVENLQLQDQSRALSIMEERRRLASELHDSVTQTLFTLSLTAQGLKTTLSEPNDANGQALELLIGQTKQAQAEMRTLINELRPVDLEQEQLDLALRRHVSSLEHAANVKISLSILGDLASVPCPLQRSLNRITQEALSNIARHAHAHQVDICLEITPKLTCLTVKDDGKGFDPQAVLLNESGSLGLQSMRERTELMGGTLLVRSQPGHGTIITAKVPLTIKETASV